MKKPPLPDTIDRAPAASPDREDGGPRLPLWAQLKSWMLGQIASGALSPHDKLPSEAELCARFGVSRTVVREALKQLVSEQRIYKMQGKGSFVSAPRTDQDFVGSTMSFTADLQRSGHVVTRRVLNQALRSADEEEARLLKLGEAETDVVELDRILIVDGEPRTRVVALLRASAVPGLAEAPMGGRSLYQTLQQRYGIVLQKAERWISAENADAETAGLLEIAPQTAVLNIQSVSVDQTGRPVELYYAQHRTDKGRLHFFIK
ncbi:GntR family transcriptional regulator [Mangrovicoccus ximenensis]|uniref:GntR family transcriptional regulator n=1 Tax=Mangrovicoccus ximenensis TaxID=1911570 RepID=UPI000D3B5D99|nr:GntR family transcriptional regulator [Mangrovicoccus ximenensis]